MSDVCSTPVAAGIEHANAGGQHLQIRRWQQFARHVRANGCKLLARLDDFPGSVLVTGCQRSGTTMLARTITQSEGMVDFRIGRDDELDAALILSGYARHSPQGRYCFQTTYLNECYREYLDHRDGHRIIWVLRHPRSVVYSLVHNWSQFAFSELFDACGEPLLSEMEKRRYRRFGRFGVSRLRRACMAYNGKTSQLFEIVDSIGKEGVMVVDYDELVREKVRLLPRIYQFIGLPYSPEYGENISPRSLAKFQKLSVRERTIVEELCEPVYERARLLRGDLQLRDTGCRPPPL